MRGCPKRANRWGMGEVVGVEKAGECLGSEVDLAAEGYPEPGLGGGRKEGLSGGTLSRPR